MFIWGVLSTHSLPLLPGPLWPRVVVSIRAPPMSEIDFMVPSISQIDWFKNNFAIDLTYAKNSLKK